MEITLYSKYSISFILRCHCFAKYCVFKDSLQKETVHIKCIYKKHRTFLVAQWLRIHLPMQGTRVRSLVRGATKPVHHNYQACALEPVCCNY